MIGPGAIIDPALLFSEWQTYIKAGRDVNMLIHERAACVIRDRHCAMERNLVNYISSTCKGTGAAQADKIMRDEGAIARVNSAVAEMCKKDARIRVVDHFEWMGVMGISKFLMIESAQGMELGVSTGSHYPFCTSRDITVWQVMSDCGIPASFGFPKVYVTLRTFPIRVGNAYDADGAQVGFSGPVYADQRELSWEDLGVPLERTTVTQKIRRVFTFSYTGFDKMVKMFNPDGVFLNFVNYLEDKPTFSTPATASMIATMESRYIEFCQDRRIPICMPLVRWIGTGAQASDVIARPTVEPI
jgi:adenylosuccinate synthase